MDATVEGVEGGEGKEVLEGGKKEGREVCIYPLLCLFCKNAIGCFLFSGYFR